jgi:sulfate/thiosulfate transport system ATP-binding protein
VSISLENVSTSFGAQRVLDHVSDVVPTGSLTALLGPSGSGKSTLLRVVAGLAPLDEGRVVFDVRDVTDLPTRHRRIGFCFQDYAPFWHMTVADNVGFGLSAQRVPRERRRREVAELLDLVHIGDLAERYPRQLSGGQRQRMALARALAIKPEVLLLDEPFAALDAQVRGDLRAWVRSLQRELAITTILVTHDQLEAMEVADRIVILHQGRIEQTGAPDEVYDRPANDFVRGFLGPTTSLDGVAYRPHQLELARTGEAGTRARVTDVARLGFEVRVSVHDERGETTWVQLTHDEAARRGVAVGDEVVVRPRGPYVVASGASRASAEGPRRRPVPPARA